MDDFVLYLLKFRYYSDLDHASSYSRFVYKYFRCGL